MSSDVDGYVSKVDPKLRGQFEELRSIIKKALPTVSESVKWGVPFYLLDGAPVASIAEYRDHVNLYFMQGAKLSSDLLEGTGKGMRHITVRSLADIEEPEMIRLLKEQRALAARGPQRKRKRTRPQAKKKKAQRTP